MDEMKLSGQSAVWPSCLRADPVNLGIKPKGTSFQATLVIRNLCTRSYYVTSIKEFVSWITKVHPTAAALEPTQSVSVTIEGSFPQDVVGDFGTDLEITITGPITKKVPIYGKVEPPPKLRVSPTTIDLGKNPAGTSFYKTFNVQNAGGGTLRVYISGGTEWLSVGPTDFNLTAGKSQAVGISGHFPSSDNDFPAIITLTSNGGEEKVRVDGSVAEARLDVSPREIDLGIAIPDTPFDRVLTIKNTGGGTLVGSVQSRLDWIEVNPSDFGVTSGAVAYIGMSGRFPPTIGPIHSVLTVNSNGGDLLIPVHGEVEDAVELKYNGTRARDLFYKWKENKHVSDLIDFMEVILAFEFQPYPPVEEIRQSDPQFLEALQHAAAHWFYSICKEYSRDKKCHGVSPNAIFNWLGMGMESAKRRFSTDEPVGERNLSVARLVVSSTLNPPDPEWKRAWVGEHPYSWANYIYEGQTQGSSQNQYFERWRNSNAYVLTLTQANYWINNYEMVGGAILADIAFDHWAKKEIDEAFVKRIMPLCGVAPPRFCPNDSVPRREVAVYVLKSKYGKDYDPPAAHGNGFQRCSSRSRFRGLDREVVR
jgi:hypothetical protein